MKKVMTFMMMAVMVLVMASCGSKGSNEDAKAVADKVAAGEALTQADYTTMIDYCANYAEKAQPYFDTINAGESADSKGYTDAVNTLADMASKAVYLDTFRAALASATPDQLGAENVKKMDALAKYEAFPIGDVPASQMMNPDVVGDIVDMPSSDSAGVIANGDGEVVVNK